MHSMEMCDKMATIGSASQTEPCRCLLCTEAWTFFNPSQLYYRPEPIHITPLLYFEFFEFLYAVQPLYSWRSTGDGCHTCNYDAPNALLMWR